MKIRIKDIAERASVSVGTVDRVIHNRSEVSETTRNKVLSILKEMNYTPDMLARALALKKKIKIALLLPETTSASAYWAIPLKGIEKAMDEYSHYGLITKTYFFNLFDDNSFVSSADAAMKDNVNAVVTVPVFKTETLALAKECSKHKVPLVLIDSNLDEVHPLSFIGQSAWHSGQVAAKLLCHGLTSMDDLLVVNVAKERDNVMQFSKRVDGFKDFIKQLPDNIRPGLNEILVPDPTGAILSKELKSAINEKTKGVFVPNSRVFRIADYFESAAVKDIRLVGYDLLEKNVQHLKNGRIDFLISQRSEEQGYKAIQTILNHTLFNKQVEPLQHLPIDILTRENIDFYTN